MFSESYDQQLSDVSILYLDLLSFAILLFYYKLIQTEKEFFLMFFVRFYKPKSQTIIIMVIIITITITISGSTSQSCTQ